MTTLIAHAVIDLSKTSKFDVEILNLVLKLCEDIPLSLNVEIRNFPVHDVRHQNCRKHIATPYLLKWIPNAQWTYDFLQLWSYPGKFSALIFSNGGRMRFQSNSAVVSSYHSKAFRIHGEGLQRLLQSRCVTWNVWLNLDFLQWDNNSQPQRKHRVV